MRKASKRQENRTQESMRVHSVVKLRGRVVGYIVIDTKTGKTYQLKTEEVVQLLEKKTFENVVIEKGTGKILNTECSMSRLPVMEYGKPPTTGDTNITIIGVGEEGSRKYYRVLDGKGRIRSIGEQKLKELVGGGARIVNGKVVNRGGKQFICAIKGEFAQIDRETESRAEDKKARVAQEERAGGEVISVIGEPYAIREEGIYCFELDKILEGSRGLSRPEQRALCKMTNMNAERRRKGGVTQNAVESGCNHTELPIPFLNNNTGGFVYDPFDKYPWVREFAKRSLKIIEEAEENDESYYDCDECEERHNADFGIFWVTSSYGLCTHCYHKLTEDEIEKLTVEYE